MDKTPFLFKLLRKSDRKPLILKWVSGQIRVKFGQDSGFCYQVCSF